MSTAAKDAPASYAPHLVMFGGIGVGLLCVALSGVIVVGKLSYPTPIVAQVPQQPGEQPPRPAPATTPAPSPAPSPGPTLPQGSPAVTSVASPPASSSVPPAAGTPTRQSRIANVELTLGDVTDALAQRPIECLSGSFMQGGGTLTTSPGICKLQFPSQLQGNYLIEIGFTRTSGDNALKTHLSVGGRECAFVLDGFVDEGGAASGFDAIDGLRPSRRPGAIKGPQVTTGRPALLRLAVLDNRLIAELSGKVIDDWTGDPARLTAFAPGQFGQPGRLRLTTWNSSYRIDRLRLTPVLSTKASSAASTPPVLAALPPAPVGSIPTPEDLRIHLGRPVDLMRAFGGTAGSFTQSGKSVITADKTLCKLAFSQRPPASYVVEARVTRVTPLESIAISFSVGGASAAWVIDGWGPSGGPFSGLDMIDNRRVPDNPTRVRGPQLVDNQPADLRLIVLADRIVAQIDGRTVVDWKGTPSQLTETQFTKLAGRDRLGIVTHFAGYAIDSAQLYPIESSGELLVLSQPQTAPAGSPRPPNKTISKSPSTKPSKAPATTPAAVAKSPVPAEATQEPIRVNLAKVFGDQLAKAKKPEEKAKLAREMAAVVKNEPDAATRYVLLTAARKLAIGGLDFEYAVELAGTTAAQFAVEPVALRLETLDQARGAAGTFTDAQKSLAELSAALAEESLAGEKYDVADAASQIAVDSGIKSKDPDTRRETKELRDEIVAEKRQWDATQAALETLKSQPNDAASHLVAGRYYGLAREDWSRALPHLAASGDATLAPAAAAEQEAKDAAGQLTAAEKWQAAAVAAKGAERLTLARHALSLCEQAAPQLAGLPKVRAEKSQGELQTLIAEAEKLASGSAAVAKKPRTRSGRLEPGLIVRTFRGDMGRPSTAISIVKDSDDYYNQALDAVQNIVTRGFGNDYYVPLAGGYLVMDQGGTVELELKNCTCLVNGAKFAENTGSTPITVQKQLSKGRHQVTFVRAQNTGFRTAPEFRIKLQNSTKNIVFHSPQDLQIELARLVYVNGNPGLGVVVYRTQQQ